ncbi:adenosine kinase [Rhodobacteraceae bacterium WD3A24]|nr:adenosine kinase [Rhodobacteraceae bacterium WD3A24]
MTDNSKRIVGVGNALVDVVASVEADVIGRHQLTHGGMHLVDGDAARALFAEVGPGVSQSGGSVANSIAHLADLGLPGTYLGKVADDTLGEKFFEEMSKLGIAAPVARLNGGTGTGHCVVLVTPDGERTMSTHLGAAQALTPADIAASMPESFALLMVEGYLWDAPEGAAVIEAAAKRAKAAGAKVALTPSDAGCVERNRDAMMAFIEGHCDILIGNHVEVGALAGSDDTEKAMDWALSHVGIAAVTESEKGSLVADASGRHRIAAEPIDRVVDSTGAGDAYASGFLGGLVSGTDVADAGRQGARLAARVLTHYGARDGEAARALAIPAA